MSDRPFRVNVPSYISGELADYLEEHAMNNSRSRPYHPQIQSKIERWYRSLMNQILLENYYLPGDLADCIGQFVDYYNHERPHRSLGLLTPKEFTKKITRQGPDSGRPTGSLRRGLSHTENNNQPAEIIS